MKKILAIASMGGHWIQLLRLSPAFEGMEVVYVSNNQSFSAMVSANKFYAVTDANRKNKIGLIKSFVEVFKIVWKEKPDVVVTTGAAPGIMGLVAGRLLSKKTVWIDSIANVDELSMSGRLASRFADRVYTQWPDLATGNIVYSGNILS